MSFEAHACAINDAFTQLVRVAIDSTRIAANAAADSAEPDLVKIDVAGFEHLVLSSASRVLSKFRPRIVLEANPGDPGTAMTQILSKRGYGFQKITDIGLEMRSEIIPVGAYPNRLCVPTS